MFVVIKRLVDSYRLYHDLQILNNIHWIYMQYSSNIHVKHWHDFGSLQIIKKDRIEWLVLFKDVSTKNGANRTQPKCAVSFLNSCWNPLEDWKNLRSRTLIEIFANSQYLRPSLPSYRMTINPPLFHVSSQGTNWHVTVQGDLVDANWTALLRTQPCSPEDAAFREWLNSFPKERRFSPAGQYWLFWWRGKSIV